ncbi:hypothetical protein IFO70_32735 [Phormidium tenue FACHB-886]|nr:hypothetical protein [Phormidium tenue FACHB-886]
MYQFSFLLLETLLIGLVSVLSVRWDYARLQSAEHRQQQADRVRLMQEQ